jgi:hypothetical protein
MSKGSPPSATASSDRSTARRLYSCDAVKIFCDKNGKVPRVPDR